MCGKLSGFPAFSSRCPLFLLDVYTRQVLYLTQVPAGTYWVNAGTIAKQSRVASIEVTGESCGFDLELEG